MKLRNTIILVAIALALGAYVVFFEMRKDDALDETLSDAAIHISNIEPNEVIEFIVHDGESSIRIFRADDAVTWMIEQTEAVEADPDRVQRAIALVVRSEIERSLSGEDAGELASYGLDSPTMDIAIKTLYDTEWILLIGDQNPGGSLHYVMEKNGKTVYMISSNVVDAVRSLVSNPPYRPTPTPMASSTPAR